MFVGEEDVLGTIEDAKWLKEQIGGTKVNINLLKDTDHSSFTFGKDMRFVKQII